MSVQTIPTTGAGVKPPVDPSTTGKLRKAAENFEAMTLGQMLKPMFATVDSSKGAFGGGAGEAQWQPMLVEAVAREAVQAGGVGIAASAYAAMVRMQEAAAGGTTEEKGP